MGSVLWNLLYDDLFKMKLPEGVIFTDYVAMTVVAKTQQSLMVSAKLDLVRVAY